MAKGKRDTSRNPQHKDKRTKTATKKNSAHRLCNANEKDGVDIESMAQACINERTHILETQRQL
eukprot:15366530-Ditylum_brightwellii.AAC.1